jgi:polar amino acid transport system permease protein
MKTAPPRPVPSAVVATRPSSHRLAWAVAAALVVVAAWLGAAAVHAGVVDQGVVRRFLFNRTILEGLRNTLVISLAAQAVGIALGLVLAVVRLSTNPVVALVSRLYIWFFRGTPVLVQLIFWFNAVPAVFRHFTIGVPFTSLIVYRAPMVEVMTPFVAALLGLGLNEGAYMAEIVRAGILSVDEGQTDAALALGMTRRLALRRVVLPQAMRMIVPPTGNEFISMLKTSSLASVVLYGELLRRAQDIYSSNLAVLELLVVASVWYLVLTTLASAGQRRVERRFSRGFAADPSLDVPLRRRWLAWRGTERR